MYVNRAIMNPASRSNNSHVTYNGYHLPSMNSKGEKEIRSLWVKGNSRHRNDAFRVFEHQMYYNIHL